jgi:hypothetical protein
MKTLLSVCLHACVAHTPEWKGHQRSAHLLCVQKSNRTFASSPGELSGNVSSNEVPMWSTRAAALSFVTQDGRAGVLKVADASLRLATGDGSTGDIGDSSEILQTIPTLVNRTYVIRFDVWVADTDSTAWWHKDFCEHKDSNGILIIRNTVEDDYTDTDRFSGLLCPSSLHAGQWQTVTGTFKATSSSTTFALHSEGTKSAYFDRIEVVDSLDGDINSRNHPATGSASITVYGSGFAGADATVMTRSGVTAAEATLWNADTACLSRFPAGIMATQSSVMSIERWVSTLTEAMTFDIPSLLLHAPNLAILSALVVTTSGSNFGSRDTTTKLRLGFTSVERSTWISNTVLTWYVPLISCFACFLCSIFCD